jgi:Domain of unknown function (DUF222)
MFDELSDPELADRLCEQAAHVHAATSRLLTMIAAFDRRRGWDADGCVSLAQWLSWRCGIGLRSAQEHVSVARRLESLPLVQARFAAGELSYSKVRALCRMATPSTERDLVDSALAATAAQIETVGRLYRRVKRLDAGNHEHERRHLRWSWDDDGSLEVRARLTADEGARFVAAIEARCPRRPHASIDHARADALCTAITGGGRGVTTEVVVHADVELLTGESDDGSCYVESGAPLAAETARRLACDGRLRLVAERHGEQVGVGRASRAVGPSLRRALRARDGGCVFPGCTNRRWVDAHHVHHWARGGRTDLGNLVELCRRHHRLVHEGGFRLAFDGTTVTVHDRKGRDLTAAPTSGPARGDAIEVQHARAGLEIDGTTAMARYGAGERPDYRHWIDAIMSNERLPEGRW